jgi:ubiquinone biosynthesis protein
LLSPKFSLIEVMRPHQKKMFLRRVSPRRQLKKMRRIYFELEHLIEVLPRRVLDIMQQFESGKLDVHLDHRGLEPSVNRLVLGMLSSAIFLGSSWMLAGKVAAPLWDISIPGTLGCMVSVALGLRVMWAVRKSGNLDRRK